MRIEEAIKYLQADLLKPGSVLKLEFQDAEQLGIEALKLVIKGRTRGYEVFEHLLPGET